ncbi:MAG: hypothetical protein K2G70_08015 [Turicibacter sp.]|nr:hypothetical protein [Turicibacter sp.]
MVKKKGVSSKNGNLNSRKPPDIYSSRNGMNRKQKEKLKRKAEKEEKKKIQKQLRELNKRRKPKSRLVKSCQDSIPYIADYEKGVLELERVEHKASIYSMMMEFEDTNYQILSIEKGEGIFTKFRDLLNTFQPKCFYQISVVKQGANEKLLEEDITQNFGGNNEKIVELQRERNSIIMNSISEEKENRRKKLYLTVAITAKNQLEAFSNFARIETDLQKAFKKLESKAKRMDTMERLEVYHDIYRPEYIGHFNKNGKMNYKQMLYKNYSMKDYICPDGMSFWELGKIQRGFTMGERYYQCVQLNNFPASLDDQLIGELTELDMDLILTISIRPYITQDAATMIKRQIASMEKDKVEQQKKAIKAGYDMDMINHDLRYALENAERMLSAMQNNNQKMFDVSVMIMHSAKTEAGLQSNLESLRSVASKYLCHVSILNFLQEPAANQIIPYGNLNLPSLFMPMPSESVAGFIPFASLEILDSHGIWYGRNAITKKLLKIDRTLLLNSNGFVLGTSGSGKSMFGKNEIFDVLLSTYTQQDDVIIIDPENEYRIFHECGCFNSAVVDISASSNIFQNPMDMDKDYGIAEEVEPLKAKAEFVVSVLSEAITRGKDMTGGQLGILDRCIREVYKDYIESDYNPEYIPTFENVQEILDQYAKRDPEAHMMAKSFEPFSKGLLNYFSHKTNVNVTGKRLVIYNIKDLGDSLKNIGYLVMLDAIWNQILKNRENGRRTRLYVDEFTVLLSNSYARNVFWNMFKRVRKMGGIVTGLTQNVTSLLRDGEQMEMLANAEFLALLSQKDTDRIKLGEIMELSEEQLKYVTNSERGSGLIVAGGKVVPFEMKYPENTKLYQMMTTKVEDRFEQQKKTS